PPLTTGVPLPGAGFAVGFGGGTGCQRPKRPSGETPRPPSVSPTPITHLRKCEPLIGSPLSSPGSAQDRLPCSDNQEVGVCRRPTTPARSVVAEGRKFDGYSQPFTCILQVEAGHLGHLAEPVADRVLMHSEPLTSRDRVAQLLQPRPQGGDVLRGVLTIVAAKFGDGSSVRRPPRPGSSPQTLQQDVVPRFVVGRRRSARR